VRVSPSELRNPRHLQNHFFEVGATRALRLRPFCVAGMVWCPSRRLAKYFFIWALMVALSACSNFDLFLLFNYLGTDLLQPHLQDLSQQLTSASADSNITGRCDKLKQQLVEHPNKKRKSSP